MCTSSTTTGTMSPSLIAHKHAGHISMERYASSLSTASSEFEFDSCSFPELYDEAPRSPKLLYSPTYSDYSPNGERPSMASSYPFTAERDMHASKAEYVEQQGFDDHLPYEAPVLRINHESASAGEEKKRVNLRSLLNRRDLKQLPPLTNYNIKSNLQINRNNIKKRMPVKRSSPASTYSASSASPSSSPIYYFANQSTNPCKFEDNQEDHSASYRKSCQKKSRKWTFKLDFLRKGPSPRAHPALNQSSNEYSLNQSIISNRPDRCSIAAAAEEARLDDYPRERDTAASAAGEGNNYQPNHRIDRYRAAAAATEARLIQSSDNYRVITKYESPRQSTSSVSSSVPRCADNQIIRANISKSAPISSPPRAPGESAFTRGEQPMSPHALHYEQQRQKSLEEKLSCLTANLS